MLFLRLREAVVGDGTHAASRSRPTPTAADRAGRGLAAHPPGRRAAHGPCAHRRRRGGTALGAHHEGAALDARPARRGARRAGRAPRRRRASSSWPAGPPTPSRARWRPRRVRALAAALPKATLPARPAAGQRLRRARHGTRARGPAGPGQPRCGRASASRPPGARSPPAPGSRRPTILASMAGEHDDGRRECGTVTRARPAGRRPARATSPTTPWPSRRCRAGHFVVAVTGHPSQSVDAHADVVLPCAVAHERAGHDDQHRGAGQPARARSCRRPASPGRTG